MGIVSYAQNFEDVLLWRALGHVDKGAYVDIGAQDPAVDSVSRAFYERGWRGVHVEPVAAYAERLRQARPDEIVIEAAAAGAAGHLQLFEIAETGLSTAVREIAEHHRRDGRQAVEIAVAAVTLDQIFACAKVQEIHWLKIDVEGF